MTSRPRQSRSSAGPAWWPDRPLFVVRRALTQVKAGALGTRMKRPQKDPKRATGLRRQKHRHSWRQARLLSRSVDYLLNITTSLRSVAIFSSI